MKKAGRVIKRCTIILIIVFLASVINAQTPKPLTIGVSYDQMVVYLDQYIPMLKSSDVNEQPRYLGQTADKFLTLEIIGEKDDILQTTFMTSFINDKPNILVRNSVMLMKFMNNAVSEWDKSTDWILSTLDHLNSSNDTKENIRIGNKLINLTMIKAYGIVSVTVKHKDSADN